MRLIDGKQLRVVLEKQLEQCSDELVVISAYVTETAIDWIEKHIRPEVHVSIICRLNPDDIVNGSTNISALRTAINNQWKVSCLHSLHAKIYSIDQNKIYVGSANLTSNGLRIYGKGNLEACTEVPANSKNIDFLNSIQKSSTLINDTILDKMEECLQAKQFRSYLNSWPNDVLQDSEGLWVRDMFWCNLLNAEHSDNEEIHDLDILGLEHLSPQSKGFMDRVSSSRAIWWLTELVSKSENQELYFGAITKALHEELADDPTPYRQDVKKLVQNLLSYCKVCLPDQFEISRPNHSERIKLLVTG